MTPDFRQEARRLLEELADEAHDKGDRLLLEQIALVRETVLDQPEHDLLPDSDRKLDESSRAVLPASELVRFHRALAERCTQVGALDLALEIRGRVVVEAEHAFGSDAPETREERARVRGERRKVRREQRTHPFTVDPDGQGIGLIAALAGFVTIVAVNLVAYVVDPHLTHRARAWRSLLVLAATFGSLAAAEFLGDGLLWLGQRYHHQRPRWQQIAERVAPRVVVAIVVVGPVIASLFLFRFI